MIFFKVFWFYFETHFSTIIFVLGISMKICVSKVESRSKRLQLNICNENDVWHYVM